jgi:hypothetical protein
MLYIRSLIIGVDDMNAKQTKRVEWNEARHDEGLFLVIAEWTGVEWEFWERDSWEVRWYPMVSRPDLIAHAEALGRECQTQDFPAEAA